MYTQMWALQISRGHTSVPFFFALALFFLFFVKLYESRKRLRVFIILYDLQLILFFSSIISSYKEIRGYQYTYIHIYTYMNVMGSIISHLFFPFQIIVINPIKFCCNQR